MDNENLTTKEEINNASLLEIDEDFLLDSLIDTLTEFKRWKPIYLRKINKKERDKLLKFISCHLLKYNEVIDEYIKNC